MATGPGEHPCEQPVLTFDGGPDWEILVYFVRSSLPVLREYPEALYDKLQGPDSVPVCLRLRTLPVGCNGASARSGGLRPCGRSPARNSSSSVNRSCCSKALRCGRLTAACTRRPVRLVPSPV